MDNHIINITTLLCRAHINGEKMKFISILSSFNIKPYVSGIMMIFFMLFVAMLVIDEPYTAALELVVMLGWASKI